MTTLQPGQMLGPYQIILQIGQGGMATVYKAYHAAMDRYVALKVVASQLSSEPDFLQRFRQEARLIAKLEHPRILTVHDFGEADGVPYMVMRFLDAGTLKERLAAGPLSLPEVDRIFSQLADALGYAHENGVIHRDIKPSNAMLDKRGDVFLTDFGVAKMLEGSSGLTATGAVTGTPAYMSPEQAQGLKVDQRSDIYSLGVVLFEMLTGHVPFEAETPMAVLFKQIQNPPPPLSVVRPDLPYVFEAVLLKALAKNPADRYASMEAFEQAWKQALAEAATLPAQGPAVPQPAAPPVPAPAPAKAVVAKKGAFPVIPLVIVGVLVCLAVGGFAVYRVAERFRAQQANRLSAPTIGAPTTGASTAAPAGATVAKITSWAGANSVYAIAFRGDQVLAAGPGGLTLWKRSDWSHQQFGTADGLPSAYADAVFVDTDQSLWVGTDSGMLHNTANQNTLYTSDQGLDSDYVSAIARGGTQLYAGTQYSGKAGGGLLELNGAAWTAVPGFPSQDNPGANAVSENVNQLAVDPAGNLWVATDNGLAMLDAGQHWNVFKTPAGLPDNNVYTVYVDGSGEVLTGTPNGSVTRFNATKHSFESYLDLSGQGLTDIYAIQQDKDGNLWFAGDNVASYNPTAKTWMRFSADDGSLPVRSVRSIGMDGQGSLYFGTDEQGLLRYSAGKFTLEVVPNAPHFAEYGHILASPDGKLIFSELYGDGADVFDPKSQTWNVLPAEQHTPLAFDPHGQLWSTDGDGLWIFGTDKTTHLTTAQGLPSNEVHAVVFGPLGAAYVATSAGIAVSDGQKISRVITAARDGLASDNVSSLMMTRDGALWAGTDGGFSRRMPDGKWQHFSSQKLFASDAQSFPEFAFAGNGDVWVATSSDGLYHFSSGKWQRLLSTDPGVGLPSDDVISVRYQPGQGSGTLWAGTDGAGAVSFDGNTWKAFGVKDGLIDAHVNDIFVDASGAVWFATGGGITRLQP